MKITVYIDWNKNYICMKNQLKINLDEKGCAHDFLHLLPKMYRLQQQSTGVFNEI